MYFLAYALLIFAVNDILEHLSKFNLFIGLVLYFIYITLQIIFISTVTNVSKQFSVICINI